MNARKCLQASPEIHTRVKAYAQLTGQSIAAAVAEILDDWLSTVGEARAETIMERAHSDVFHAPANIVDISSAFSC